MKPFQIQFKKSILNKMIIIPCGINCVKRRLAIPYQQHTLFINTLQMWPKCILLFILHVFNEDKHILNAFRCN